MTASALPRCQVCGDCPVVHEEPELLCRWCHALALAWAPVFWDEPVRLDLVLESPWIIEAA